MYFLSSRQYFSLQDTLSKEYSFYISGHLTTRWKNKAYVQTTTIWTNFTTLMILQKDLLGKI